MSQGIDLDISIFSNLPHLSQYIDSLVFLVLYQIGPVFQGLEEKSFSEFLVEYFLHLTIILYKLILVLIFFYL